jgi:hypothetical protein
MATRKKTLDKRLEIGYNESVRNGQADTQREKKMRFYDTLEEATEQAELLTNLSDNLWDYQATEYTYCLYVVEQYDENDDWVGFL